MDTGTSLAQYPVFCSLSEEGRQLLTQGLVRQRAGRHEALLHKGQPVSGAYVVLGGRLRVFTITPGGTEATLYFIDPGDTCVLALNCLFNDLLYPAWVRAEEATEIGVIPGPVYRRLFETEPAIRELTVHTLAALVFRLMSELEQIHSTHHRERLAQFILNHAASDGRLHMTQQQLAGHLGTTREVIARLMQEFVGRGWVRTGRGEIAIRDLFGLRALLTSDASALAPARKRTSRRPK